MKLEQFYVFPIDSALNGQKRKLIDAQIDANAKLFDREVEYKWLKRGEEKFLRLVISPVTVEIVFHDDRVELFGAAPAWARALFTNARKQELQQRIEEVLVVAGFRK